MSESALLLFIILLHHLEETLPPLDIPPGGGLDQSLTLKFNKDRASLKAGCYDIFETQGVSPYINYGNQVVSNWYPSYRSYNVTFTNRFGAYKEKKRDEVDANLLTGVIKIQQYALAFLPPRLYL